MKSFIKKTLVTSVLSLAFVSGCANKTTVPSEEGEKIELVEFNDVVDIHTEIQSEFILERFDVASEYNIDGKHELSKPLKTTFNRNLKGCDPKDIKYYELKISEYEDFKDSKTIKAKSNSAKATNFKIDQKYYWKVIGYKEDREISSPISTFQTYDEGPRNLDIDGITNVRDLGGYYIDDDKYVKQGLIYRCGRLNYRSVEQPSIQIGIDGIAEMRDYLKIKSEIDLRMTEDNEVGSIDESPLGSDINYYQCPMNYEGNILLSNKQMVASVFELLGVKENYPLIFHCNIGTDRTGLIAYLLNGLLGVSESDLILDYEFSNLGNIGGTRQFSRLRSSYVATIGQTEGADLSEKCENYLLGLGVAQKTIDNIKTILS